MRDRTIVTLVPRDTTPARMLDAADDDLAPVVPLRAHVVRGNRVIHPVDAFPGTALGAHGARAGRGADLGNEPPGPLARALMAIAVGADG